MILSGHQPNYLPYPGLIGKIMMSDKFIYVTKVQFNKKSWQNRNRIKTRDGWIWLTVPTLTKGKYEQNICDVKINNNLEWKKKHWRSIVLNYKGAPFFKDYKDFFEDLYTKEWEYLSELDIHIMNFVLQELDVKTVILYDKDFEFVGNKTDLLVDMCNKTGCDTYLSNRGSEAYVEIESFEKAGIGHRYMEYIGVTYPQINGSFEPNLSIIDMLFNCGKEMTKDILTNMKNYKLSKLNEIIIDE